MKKKNVIQKSANLFLLFLLVTGVSSKALIKSSTRKSKKIDTTREEKASKIIIEAYNFKNQKGFFRVKLFKKEHDKYFPSGNKEGSYHKRGYSFINKKNKAIFVFKNVSQGEYAVSVFHDENNSGKLEKNLFGIPKKDWAVSNNIRHPFSAPKFKESSFLVTKNKNTTITLKMK